MQGLSEIKHVKPDGKCSICDTKLVITKPDHIFLRTKGYAKDFGGGKKIVKCPKCNNEQLVS